jgi:hypothetical protein
VAEAEAILRQLREIEHAAITTDGEEIKEVHVVARTARRPKQIVRDVESALAAFLNRSIDHRIISVVLLEGTAPAPARPAAVAAPVPAPTPAPLEPSRRVSPAGSGTGGYAEARVPHADRPPAESQEAAGSRVRFVSANLFVSGLRTQAQVEIEWRGVTRLGSATGVSARANAERLVAQATLQALQPFLGETRALALEDVTIVQMARQEVVVASVKLLEARRERSLTGSCTVEQDVPQSVVYATLSALNRILGVLSAAEPTEYELRPAST